MPLFILLLNILLIFTHIISLHIGPSLRFLLLSSHWLAVFFHFIIIFNSPLLIITPFSLIYFFILLLFRHFHYYYFHIIPDIRHCHILILSTLLNIISIRHYAVILPSLSISSSLAGYAPLIFGHWRIIAHHWYWLSLRRHWFIFFITITPH